MAPAFLLLYRCHLWMNRLLFPLPVLSLLKPHHLELAFPRKCRYHSQMSPLPSLPLLHLLLWVHFAFLPMCKYHSQMNLVLLHQLCSHRHLWSLQFFQLTLVFLPLCKYHLQTCPQPSLYLSHLFPFPPPNPFSAWKCPFQLGFPPLCPHFSFLRPLPASPHMCRFHLWMNLPHLFLPWFLHHMAPVCPPLYRYHSQMSRLLLSHLLCLHYPICPPLFPYHRFLFHPHQLLLCFPL